MATLPISRMSQRADLNDPPRPRPPGISRVPYLPGLDGMRALAVVAVMVYHANPDWLPGGFLGVEVFFVISGYLITLLIIAERERTGRIDLKHFWIRRAKRLLPALFVMLFLVITYTALFESNALGQLRGDVVAGLTYVTNWYQIWVGQGYTAAGDFAPLRHLWSLAVEEQFYLVWPLVMVALLSRGPRQVARTALWLVAAAMVVTVVMAVAFQPGRIGECSVTPEQYWTVGERCISKLDTLYLSSVTRSSGLLLGAAFAMLWRPVAIMRSPLRNKAPLLDLLALVGVIGLAAMIWFVYLVSPDGADPFLFRGGFVLCAVLSLLIIAAVTHERALTPRVLANPVLLWVGTRSYGLYLYHWPIYQAIRKVAGNPLSLTQFIFAMLLTGVITEASFRFVETPIRTGHLRTWWSGLRRSRDPLPRQIFLGAAAVAVAVGLFSSVSLATAPLKQNEIAVSLDEAAGAVTDLSDLLGDPDGGPGGGAGDVEGDDGAVPGAPGEPDDGGGPDNGPDNGTGSDAGGPDEVGSGTGGAEPTIAPPDLTTTTTTTTTLPPEPIKLLAVGDSVMLGAAQRLRDNGMVVDAAESRQMLDMVPVMQRLREQDRFGTAVVVHLGTNGSISQDTVDAFMAPLVEVPNVIVMTVKAQRNWTAGNNDRLRALGARPNVILLDWEILAGQCPGDCFYSDGIHLRPEGQAFYSRQIFDVLGI
jgi:peptidoglycan/LPS O-acetylase OafA/YrhL